MARKCISILLAALVLFGCFGAGLPAIKSTAAEQENIDVKIIRPLNDGFSMKKIYENNDWNVFAFADKNGEPIVYETNPFHLGGVYRGREFIAEEVGYKFYANLEGFGAVLQDVQYRPSNNIQMYYPSSWNYAKIGMWWDVTKENPYEVYDTYNGEWDALTAQIYQDHQEFYRNFRSFP